MDLSEQKCAACQAGGPTLSADAVGELLPQVPAWSLGQGSLVREFRFKDFRQAMAFVNRVADLAEGEGHHPDIGIYYSRVRLTLTTHKLGGLSRNDFILAAKIDALPNPGA